MVCLQAGRLVAQYPEQGRPITAKQVMLTLVLGCEGQSRTLHLLNLCIIVGNRQTVGGTASTGLCSSQQIARVATILSLHG
jgi:hypothetical protein